MPPLVAFLRVAVAVAITTAALVLPFAYAISTPSGDDRLSNVISETIH